MNTDAKVCPNCGKTYQKNTLPDGRKSIPDFLVQTKSGDKIVYEVKPTAIQQMPNVAQKLSMIEQVVRQSGKEYRLIGDIEVNEMKKALLCRQK